MGNRTKIDWCDATWNPVTGCYHGCPYCYARRIAERFDGHKDKNDSNANWVTSGVDLGKHLPRIHLYDGKIPKSEWDEMTDRPDENLAYPYGFEPTIHLHRLEEPQHWRRPRNVFVCSMGDLFGAWVPDTWKIAVLNACAKAPQHRYLFLTKNPVGFSIWPTEEYPHADEVRLITENMWIGVTWTGDERIPGTAPGPDPWGFDLTTGSRFEYLYRMSRNILPGKRHTFLSIEPIACDVTEVADDRDAGQTTLLEKFLVGRGTAVPPVFEWVIVGAETGNRKGKVKPERKWIEKLARLCRENGIPLFMKESIRGIMGEDFVQEFPWEAER